MKKVFFLCILLFPLSVYASTIVMDSDTNRVLYGESINEKKLIASTTKVMTALVVIRNIDNLDEKITINDDVLSSYGSGIYIEVGEIISIRELLYGLLLRSGNDSAIALADYVGGSIDGFAILMNETAKSLGMENTKFINPSGLEDEKGNGNTSTAYDMALLMSYAINNSVIKEIVGTSHKVVKTNFKTYDWYNKNKLLTSYKYTTGGKTGFTKLARRTLLSSASKDNKNLVCVTLNENDDFVIHQSLYEEYFKKYKLINILDKNTFMKDDDCYIKESFSMILLDKEINKVKVEVDYTNDAKDRIGFVTVSLDNKEYFKTDIYLKTKKDKLSLIDKIKDFFSSLFT